MKRYRGFLIWNTPHKYSRIKMDAIYITEKSGRDTPMDYVGVKFDNVVDAKKYIDDYLEKYEDIGDDTLKTYTEDLKGVGEVVRIKRGLSKDETLDEFEKAAKAGKKVCLTDALINCGL